MAHTQTILGIDPGFGRLGYGVIKSDGRGGWRGVEWGCVDTPAKTPIAERLILIEKKISEIINTHKPDGVAVEKLFFSKNVTTAMDVAQARGVVVLTCGKHKMVVMEYTPNQIKQSIAGYGKADKAQMQKMVAMILGIKEKIKSDDAADALAAAICGGAGLKLAKLYAKG